MSQPFYKLQATGNDFVFFFSVELKSPMTSQKVIELCSRQTGIGADGLVVLRGEADKQWEWDFYNADGGQAEMCGNAARCATHLINTRFGQKNIPIKTQAGVFNGSRTNDGDIEVLFDTPKGETKELSHLFNGEFKAAYLTNTGVPHCVIPTEDPWALRSRAKELAPHIFNDAFGAAGANLTFVNWKNKNLLETVTLERGVNDFTLSCGTGVIAAAKVFADLNDIGGWRKLKTPGGALSVFYLPGTQAVHLKGPAAMVFKGDL